VLRPQSSWMSREVWAVGMLYPLIAANFLWSSPQLWLATGFAGAAFLFCQARILYAAKGIPAWRVPLIPALVIASGLTEGAGAAMLALTTLGQTMLPPALALLSLILVPATAALWYIYVRRAPQNRIPAMARDVLTGITDVLLMWWAVAAVILLACLLLAPPPAYFAFAGIMLIATGAIWKTMVIVHASHQQGFVLPQAPGRGSGTLAAPARLEGHRRAA
jgi:phenylacetyl-CoA:acceptor oxidoreductase subunit 2